MRARLWKLPPRRLAPHVFEFRRHVPGAAPGTLVSQGEPARATITLMAYGPDGCVEETLDGIDRVGEFVGKWPVTWINVAGLGDVEALRHLGEVLGLHALALEDVLNIPQRPKVEAYGDHVFIILRMPDESPDHLARLEQVSIFVGPGFVLTIQEDAHDVLASVRHRLRTGGTRVRRHGPDFLCYSIMDCIVDSYFPLLEHIGERLATLESTILSSPSAHTVSQIYQIKRELLAVRRATWPQREAFLQLYREPSELWSAETRLHLRDCYDHVNQIIDLLENYREISSSLVDLYLSITSYRMNEIMKVLTVLATIFIPLTFIAGVYGMNFDTSSPWNMPELKWKYGYPAVMGVMTIMALVMLWFFWRRGWIAGDPEVPGLDEKP